MTEEEEEEEKSKASPYLDIQNPFGVGEDGAKAEYLLKNPEDMPELAVGAKTLVRDERDEEDLWISAQVKRLEKYAPFHPERQKKLYLEGDELDPTTIFNEVKGPHSHSPMIIGLDLQQEIRDTSDDDEDEVDYERSAVQRPPSIESEMVFPELIRDEDDEEPALEDMLQIQDKGIPLGAVGFGNKPLERNGDHLLYRWNLDDLDIKHTFVVGESGSGKTVLLKRMAQQIREKQDSSVIMTDVQGDLIQLALSRVIGSDEPNEEWQKAIWEMDEIPSEEEAIESMKPFKIVVPRNTYGERSENHQALKTVCEDIEDVEYVEIGLRLQDIENVANYEYLFKTSSPYAPQIINDTMKDLESRDKDVTIEAVEEYLRERKREAKNAGDQYNQEDVRVYRESYNISSVEATLTGALRDLKKYFDNHKPSLERDERPLDALKDEGTVILYLEELGKLEKVMYEMHTIRWLYDNRDDEDWEPYTFIDEAHQVIPERSSISGAEDTFERLKLTFEKLAREGRKYDKHLILSTQSPQDIADVVNDQCHTRVVMKLNEKNAKAAGLGEKELRNIANSFDQGQFFIRSPFNDTGNWLRLHSWLPNLPHEDINPFWNEMKKEARRIATE
ncbi:MAG: ATP-binding protein [Candidatus Nanohaloarchaea archaeon]